MINSKYQLRYANKKDFDYFYKGEQILYSSKAWVLASKRQKYAIGGIWTTKTQNTVFIKTKKDLPKKELWRASKMIIEQLRELGVPMVCFRDDTIENSQKFLEKLGFKYSGTLNNQEIYKL